MREVDNKYKSLPFWSWNDELEIPELERQIEWMHDNGIGGFFMHARGGLKTEYLGQKWFDCIDACGKKAAELGMHAYAYDENGWPSGFAGGKLLEDIENHDMDLTYKIGEYDPNSKVAYDLSGESLAKVNSGSNVLNVYESYAPSTADICNGEVMDKFIELTHEQYAKRDDYGLKGFFTDEPQYYRWGTSFTRVLPGYWKETYGEDIYDKLGLLFVEKEGYREFRYRYWKAMQRLMLDNFAKKIYDWCDMHGYKLTGHYVEETSLAGQDMCCGGIMPFYAYEHIPGIDYLSRPIGNSLAQKQLGSVAAQLGKKQTLCEMFACCGWDVTPKELKLIAEQLYVGGVNLMCHHLLPYSEHGQRKRDYPSHFSAVNPWVRSNFKQFNDYFSVLGEILSKSEERPNVAIFHPIRSSYFDFKKGEYAYKRYNIGYLDDALVETFTKFDDAQIPYHYIDETLLAEHGSVKGNKLVMGQCEYEYIVFPMVLTMDKSTESLLRQFVANGGKVLLTHGKPVYLEGQPYDYSYLESNVTFEEISSAQPFKTNGVKKVLLTHRIDENGKDFIYLVNLNHEKVAVKIDFKGYASFESYDILADKSTVISNEFELDGCGSKILYPSNKTPASNGKLNPLKLEGPFELVAPVDNYLVLDKVSYSFDGVNYSKPLLYMGVFNELLKKRYEGSLYLKYVFNVEESGDDMKILCENSHIESVCLNGESIKKSGHSKYENELFEYSIDGKVKKGLNEVIIKQKYYQDPHVYYVLFDANDTESLKNCLVYDSNVEAIFVKGKFGVYGQMKPGKNESIVLGDNFYIGKQKTSLSSLIEDGFPFFAGDIGLKKKINVSSNNLELDVPDRFHLLDVKANGSEVGKLMFDNKLDLSKELISNSPNEIELVLTVGNRNLMGPFHTPEQEDLNVGPFTWERMGSWIEGECPDLRDNYSFVRTII